ncbi:MAG: YbhN family protein [Solirubrobacteraceae bacterium]
MTASSIPIERPEGSGDGAVQQRPASSPLDRRAVLRRLLIVFVLAGGVLTLVLAVPGLRPVVREVRTLSPAAVAAAVVLELASCVSFLVIFRMFFPGIPRPVARGMAWTQMGSGALLPGGGVGSLAVGGWLLHLVGMPTREIVRRSSGLFFLTSAVNVMTLAAAGIVLLLGVGAGPHDVLRAGGPVLAAVVAAIGVLALPRLTGRVSTTHRRATWLDDIATGIPSARAELKRPTWRLLGATGYLLFDIAALWMTFTAVAGTPAVAPLVVAYLVGYLANATPIPGGIGVLDAGLVGALALYGLPVTHAAAAVLVYHAIAFWIPALGGTIAYARLRPRIAAERQPTSNTFDAQRTSLQARSCRR